MQVRVTGIGKNNCIVDCYGLESSVPINEIDYGYIDDISKCVQIGDKALGIIKEIVPNSGQPFYIDDNYNGVRYTFKTPDGSILNGSLMPTFRETTDSDGNKIQVGSHPSVKEGLEILSIE